MKILGISDNEVSLLYSPQVTGRFDDVDIILSCGDLPFFYLEYIISMLNKPFYFVFGNHYYADPTTSPRRPSLWDHANLHRRVIEEKGLLIAGIEGSLRYNQGPFQYSQEEMWRNVLHLVPQLLINKSKYGNYLDILITHAPPWGVHDKDDLPHQGIKAFRWFLKVFQPRYHLHGHIHLYSQNEPRETRVNNTKVINVYSYRVIDVIDPTKLTQFTN